MKTARITEHITDQNISQLHKKNDITSIIFSR